MENKRNQCRKCGGEGKPSKAIQNYHYIDRSYLKGEKEFETKLVSCIKCEKCGHSWIPSKDSNTSSREQAMAWWNNLNQEKQIDLQYLYRSPSRHPLNSIGLTGREIEEIWADTIRIENEVFRPNQKQFTTFSEEHFWKYFSKFSHSDKVKMFELLKSWYEVEGGKTY